MGRRAVGSEVCSRSRGGVTTSVTREAASCVIGADTLNVISKEAVFHVFTQHMEHKRPHRGNHGRELEWDCCTPVLM